MSHNQSWFVDGRRQFALIVLCLRHVANTCLDSSAGDWPTCRCVRTAIGRATLQASSGDYLGLRPIKRWCHHNVVQHEAPIFFRLYKGLILRSYWTTTMKGPVTLENWPVRCHLSDQRRPSKDRHFAHAYDTFLYRYLFNLFICLYFKCYIENKSFHW